jgi:hypothetical protein
MRIIVPLKNLKNCGCESIICGCARVIINNLSTIQNIEDVEVNEAQATVAFNYNTPHDFEAAKHVLCSIGYPITGEDNHLKQKSSNN